jgi:hypothetical protein
VAAQTLQTIRFILGMLALQLQDSGGSPLSLAVLKDVAVVKKLRANIVARGVTATRKYQIMLLVDKALSYLAVTEGSDATTFSSFYLVANALRSDSAARQLQRDVHLSKPVHELVDDKKWIQPKDMMVLRAGLLKVLSVFVKHWPTSLKELVFFQDCLVALFFVGFCPVPRSQVLAQLKLDRKAPVRLVKQKDSYSLRILAGATTKTTKPVRIKLPNTWEPQLNCWLEHARPHLMSVLRVDSANCDFVFFRTARLDATLQKRLVCKLNVNSVWKQMVLYFLGNKVACRVHDTRAMQVPCILFFLLLWIFHFRLHFVFLFLFLHEESE